MMKFYMSLLASGKDGYGSGELHQPLYHTKEAIAYCAYIQCWHYLV